MGRQHRKKRRMEIQQKQKRRIKLKKLRTAYDQADTSSEKDQILEKVKKIAPWLSKKEFLAPLKSSK